MTAIPPSSAVDQLTDAQRARLDEWGVPEEQRESVAQAWLDDAKRICYGARCSWWGSIGEVGSTHTAGLPACPRCGGVLMQVANENEWWSLVEATATEREDDAYVEFMRWLGERSKERCWPTVGVARTVWERRGWATPAHVEQIEADLATEAQARVESYLADDGLPAEPEFDVDTNDDGRYGRD